MKRLVLVLALLFSLLGFQLAVSPSGDAVTEQQCINAHTNPQGSIATQCHQLGWTVNAYIVVDPTNWVRWGDWQAFRACDQEFGGPIYPCWWNFFNPPSSGNKYYFDYGAHIHYVNGLRL